MVCNLGCLGLDVLHWVGYVMRWVDFVVFVISLRLFVVNFGLGGWIERFSGWFVVRVVV